MRTLQGYPWEATSLARRRFSCSGDGGARLRPTFAVPAAGSEPRTHELTNKGPNGAARQGRSLTNVESQAARSGKPYAARQAITIGGLGHGAAWTFGPYQCGEVWFNSYRAKALWTPFTRMSVNRLETTQRPGRDRASTTYTIVFSWRRADD